jgi:hypothetical protein
MPSSPTISDLRSHMSGSTCSTGSAGVTYVKDLFVTGLLECDFDKVCLGSEITSNEL